MPHESHRHSSSRVFCSRPALPSLSSRSLTSLRPRRRDKTRPRGDHLCFWASLNSVYRRLWEQLALGITSTSLSWVVLVVIVNEDLCYPTRQQWYSLVFYLVTELSITLQVRFVLSDDA